MSTVLAVADDKEQRKLFRRYLEDEAGWSVSELTDTSGVFDRDYVEEMYQGWILHILFQRRHQPNNPLGYVKVKLDDQGEVCVISFRATKEEGHRPVQFIPGH